MIIASARAAKFCRAALRSLAILAVAKCGSAFAQADGYAGYQFNVTGGTGGTTSIVTTATAFINAIKASTAQFIMFSNALDLGASNVDLTKNNKTVLGLGTNAAIVGDIRIIRCTNVVIRNVFFSNPNNAGDKDALTCQHSDHVWIDHCTFHDCGDGSVDITHASDNFTLSWNKFYYTTNTGHNFVNLIGHTDFNCAEDCSRLHVTFHHNWWSTLCIERMPRVRYGRIHSYNNYFNAPGNNYCIRAAISSEVFAVRNVFQNVDEPYNYFSDTGAPAGLIRAVSNSTINCTGVLSPNDTVFTPPYVWTPDETNIVAGVVTNYSGAGILPLAAFTASPTNGAAPLSVTFTDTSFGVITNRFWDFGDGNTTNTTTNVIARTFSSAGSYTVSLTVSGPVGTNTLTRSDYVVATGGVPPPVADFTAVPTNGTGSLEVTFTDASTGSITNRFWGFGDGNTTNFAAATNPMHTYAPGVYSVTLEVSGSGGSNSLLRTNLIAVLTEFEAWQFQYFGCTNCAQAANSADPDGDGMSNGDEFSAGTNPTNSASALQIISTMQQGNDITVTWTTAGGKTNAVQAAAGDANGSYTTNYTDISGPIIISGSGDMMTNYADVGGATNNPARYYRVRLVP
jgi:pectate lyase